MTSMKTHLGKAKRIHSAWSGYISRQNKYRLVSSSSTAGVCGDLSQTSWSSVFVYFLTRDKLVTAVSLVFRLNPSEYSGHSFKIGAATTAAQVSTEDSVVKMLGRWESSAYQRYIHTPRDTLAVVSAHLARGLH